MVPLATFPIVPTRIAVIYYSATGIVFSLASAIAEGAESEGAEVRLRKVPRARCGRGDRGEPAVARASRGDRRHPRGHARRRRVGRWARVGFADPLRPARGTVEVLPRPDGRAVDAEEARRQGRHRVHRRRRRATAASRRRSSRSTPCCITGERSCCPSATATRRSTRPATLTERAGFRGSVRCPTRPRSRPRGGKASDWPGSVELSRHSERIEPAHPHGDEAELLVDRTRVGVVVGDVQHWRLAGLGDRRRQPRQ